MLTNVKKEFRLSSIDRRSFEFINVSPFFLQVTKKFDIGTTSIIKKMVNMY